MRTKIREFKKALNRRPLYLLLAAALLHISVATAVLTIGKHQLMPAQFRTDGLGEFASDCFPYREEAADLVNVLKSSGLVAWATWPTQLHVRLYSLPLAAVSHWMSFNILAIEPLNLLYYLAILTLVFKLGKEVFDYRAGLMAATMLSIVMIRIIRLPMWDLTGAIVGLFAVFLLARILRDRRVLIGNVAVAAIMIAAFVITPHLQPVIRNQQHTKAIRRILPEKIQSLPVEDQIGIRRAAFGLDAANQEQTTGGPGSVIDPEVRLKGRADIIRYLPRAAVIGFFAPFPNMWFNLGTEVGASGRILSGVETLLTYAIEGFAFAGLWRVRKQLAAWLLFAFVVIGAMALGLVVSNVGALYRLRYSFWILIVVLGAGGLTHLWGRQSSSTVPQPE